MRLAKLYRLSATSLTDISFWEPTFGSFRKAQICMTESSNLWAMRAGPFSTGAEKPATCPSRGRFSLSATKYEATNG